jgi:type I restriction enzyme S subunit
MFGDPVKNEKGWEVKKLKSITTKIGSGATPTGGKTAYKAKGISLIRSMNVYDFSFKWKDLAFIDNAQASKLNNVEVMSKDVLFNITGASVCRCSIVPDELLPARVNQHVAIIRAKTEFLNPIFLNHLLMVNYVVLIYFLNLLLFQFYIKLNQNSKL